jgi:hypothetical protein
MAKTIMSTTTITIIIIITVGILDTNNEGSTAVEDVTTIIRQNYNTLLTILSNPEAFTDDNSNNNVMMVEHIKQQTQQSTNKYRYSIYRQLLERYHLYEYK